MNANSVARVGLVLLGAYLIVSAFAAISSTFTQQPIVLGGSPAAFDLRTFAINLIVGVATATVFGLLPGSFLIANSEPWAARWFPPSEPAAPSALPGSELYAIGLVLLGLYFAIDGFATLLGSAFGLVASLLAGDDASGRLLTRSAQVGLGMGLGELLGGLVLWRVGRSIARRAT